MHLALQSPRNQGTELSSSTKIPQLPVVAFLSPLYSNPDKLQKKTNHPEAKRSALQSALRVGAYCLWRCA